MSLGVDLKGLGEQVSPNRSCSLSRIRSFSATVLRGLFLVIFVIVFKQTLPGPLERSGTIGLGPSRTIRNGREAEEYFLTIPDAKSAREASRRFASRPHLAGTPGDLSTAKDFLSLLQTELGASVHPDNPIFPAGSFESRDAILSSHELDQPVAWIDEYYPVMNSPVERRLEILDETRGAVWKANLEEVPDALDEDAWKYGDTVPAFHAFSGDGEASGKLVYANYGRPEDYEELISKGISLNGTIPLVRYGGGIMRGLKIKAAQEYGASGVILYSDPREDGSVTVENGYLPYPHGPARNPTSLERGSVSFITLYPGDPTTPGYPSYKNSTRKEPITIPSIPSLPISWANAQVLISELQTASHNRSVHVVNHVDNKITPIWNTMAAVPGHIKDEVLIIGSHRDAWVMGAGDPSSGTASLHEVIRGFGALLKKGWKPLRTIIIASWDAEEFGLIGSTEWGEDFATWIQKNVVAYLNLDASVYGSRYRAHASPSLSHLVRSTAEKIPHPTKSGFTLWDATMDEGDFAQNDTAIVQPEQPKRDETDDVGVYPLGTGSDFTVFMEHLGIASSNEDFVPRPHDPVYHYHSIYDTHRWQEIYGDPTFNRHVAVAKHLGLQALGIADRWLLPLNTTNYAFELERSLNRVQDIAANLSLSVDFTPLRKSIRRLQWESRRLDREKARVSELIGDTGSFSFKMNARQQEAFRLVFTRLQGVNRKLSSFEKGFIDDHGLEGRSWYRHLGVAPGSWLGYGATPLPAVTEALTLKHNVTLAKHEAGRLKTLIDDLAESLNVQH